VVGHPSIAWRKWRVPMSMRRANRNRTYCTFFSAPDRFLVWKLNGCHPLTESCSSTAPMAILEASVFNRSGTFGNGWESSSGSTGVVRHYSQTFRVSSVNDNGPSRFLIIAARSYRGACNSAALFLSTLVPWSNYFIIVRRHKVITGELQCDKSRGMIYPRKAWAL